MIKYFTGFDPISLSDRHAEIEHVFTSGHCHSLALAIHRLTQFPLVITFRHMAVLTTTGKILDINGLRSPDIFEKRWGEIKDILLDDITIMDKIKKVWGNPYVLCSIEAKPFAKKLLRKYKLQI